MALKESVVRGRGDISVLGQAEETEPGREEG